MQIFPAIDLRDGQVVRLTEGDYNRMTVYDKDPCAVADRFISEGATNLHVVDLDAARDGAQANFTVIEKLTQKDFFMQVGGGGRDEDSVRRYIDAGVDRVIIGSAAITRSGFLEKMANLFPGKIAAGVDARGGKIAIHGWREITDVDALGFLKNLPAIGVDTAIYTDIARDGLLSGANLLAYRDTLTIDGLNVVASGGVSSYTDIQAFVDMGLYAAIIGKALYTGMINLGLSLTIAKGAKS